ncbi:MAG: DUF1214 domain-containing protein [Myxococcota bacterium]
MQQTSRADASAVASPATSARPDASASREAFRELLSLLDALSEEWIAPERGVETAERDALAHESLASVLWGALEFYATEDFDKPHFSPIVTPWRKWSDNPDARYYFTPLRGDATYRVRGRRGSEVYLNFTVHRGDRDGEWPQGVVADLNMQDMHFAPDGSYELILAAQAPRDAKPGHTNWIQLTPDAGSLIVRFYHQNETTAANDPATVPELSIELEREPDAPSPPTPAASDAEIALRLRRVANWVRSKYKLQVLSQPGRPSPSWLSTVPNTLGVPEPWVADPSAQGWGAVDVAYAAGPYELGPDQALVMEGRLPRGVFSNVVLWNEMGRTEDYRDRQVSLNARQIETDGDRRFRIVVAHRDPGLRNWLDTAGRTRGTIYWRHMLPEEPPEAIRTRVVPFDEIARSGAAAD